MANAKKVVEIVYHFENLKIDLFGAEFVEVKNFPKLLLKSFLITLIGTQFVFIKIYPKIS